LKYPSWLREQRGKLNPCEKAAFAYDEARDIFTCPQGKTLAFAEENQTTTESGYAKTMRVYECGACADCPVKSDCTRGAGGRRIQHSAALEQYRQQALSYNLNRLPGRLRTLGMGWNPFGRGGKPQDGGGNPFDRVQKAGLGRFLTA